jgi:hypothetical protein
MKSRFYEKAKDKGYKSDARNFDSLVQAITENEKLLRQSNLEEMAKHPEKTVPSISKTVPWLEDIRASIRNALSRYT